MKASDLIIEHMNVDVFAATRKDGNTYLLELSNYLQQFVFPEVEKRMEEKFPQNAQLELDRLDIDWSTTKTEEWSAEFSQYLVQTLTEELEQKYGENIESNSQAIKMHEFKSLATLLRSVDQIEVEHLPLLSVLVHFLNSGVLIKSDKGIETVQDLESSLIKSFDESWMTPLSNFLLENKQGLRRFFAHFSARLYKLLLEKRTSPELARFLSEITAFTTKKDKNDLIWAKIALKHSQFSLDKLLEELEREKSKVLTSFYQFIKENDKNTLKKHHKTIKKLMKSLDPDSPSALNLWIERQGSEIQQFIQFLQRDFSLRELLDELLIDQALKYNQSFQNLSEWQSAFVESIAQKQKLSGLLMELEDYQPTLDKLDKKEEQEINKNATQLRNSLERLIHLLEKHFEVLESSENNTPNETTINLHENELDTLTTNPTDFDENTDVAEQKEIENSGKLSTTDERTELDSIKPAQEDSEFTKASSDNLDNALLENDDKVDAVLDHTEMTSQLKDHDQSELIGEIEKKALQGEPQLISDPMKTLLENEDILAPYSGLVLLNPFLPQLLRNLNLLNEKNEWSTDQDQIWAMFTLHYLASGNKSHIPEDELILLKLLTNYPLDEPVNAIESQKGYAPFKSEEGQILLTKINAEMENILEAVRANWRPMRNCSWKGLRQDFLSRTGTLHQKNEQLVLTVKPHALDMMLPHKNWGHSMIKYSWMDEVLYVEWGSK